MPHASDLMGKKVPMIQGNQAEGKNRMNFHELHQGRHMSGYIPRYLHPRFRRTWFGRWRKTAPPPCRPNGDMPILPIRAELDPRPTKNETEGRKQRRWGKGPKDSRRGSRGGRGADGTASCFQCVIDRGEKVSSDPSNSNAFTDVVRQRWAG